MESNKENEPISINLRIQADSFNSRIDDRKPLSNINVASKYDYADLNFTVLRSVDGRLISPRAGVSCVKFDSQGVLVAVGGSNGVLRVFDFDECLSNIQQNAIDLRTRIVEPVVVFDAKRDISDIHWSSVNPDIIAIALSFYPEILVVNLNNPTTPQTVLEVGRDSVGGHTCLLLLPSWTGPQTEKIIAGGSNGSIRMWGDMLAKRKCSWDITAQKGCQGIVSLAPLNRGDVRGGFISADVNAAISIWDCKNLSTLAFGSTGIPTLLKKIYLSDQILDHGILNTRTHGMKLISLNYMQFSGNNLVATFSNGYICSFNITSSSVTKLYQPKTSLSEIQKDGDRVIAEKVYNGLSCSAAVICEHSYKLLLYQDPKTQSIQIIQSSSNIYNRINKRHALKPSFRRCYDYNMTVPGFVVEAKHGDCQIKLSGDFSEFFVPSSMAPMYPSKSHEIVIDWRMSGILNAIGVSSCCTCSISSIDRNTLTLDKPYSGPTVVNSQPRIQIRTNLAAEYYASNTSNSTSSTRSQNIHKNVGVDLPRVTIITCHPSLPYVMVGFADDSVRIITSDNSEKCDLL